MLIPPQIFYTTRVWQPDTRLGHEREFTLTPVTAFALSNKIRRLDVIDAVKGGVDILVPNGNGSTILQLLAERLIVQSGRSVYEPDFMPSFEPAKEELLKMFQFLVYHGASIENLEAQFESFTQEIIIGNEHESPKKHTEAKAAGESIRAQIKEALIDAAPTRRSGLLSTFSSLDGKDFTLFGISPRGIIADYAVETGQSAEESEKEKNEKKKESKESSPTKPSSI